MHVAQVVKNPGAAGKRIGQVEKVAIQGKLPNVKLPTIETVFIA